MTQKQTQKNLYNEVLKELWKIRNPSAIFDQSSFEKLKTRVNLQTTQEKPTILPKIKLPSKKAFFDLTTARNKNIINIDEQNLLRSTIVGFFGLSVGSHAALTWMMQSRADTIKIVDPDQIAATNLNRLRVGWDNIGQDKVKVIAQQLYQINPFTSVISSVKVSTEVINQIFTNPPIQIVVDEIDDFEGKLLLRKLAKKAKIPLISAADVGDNVILDVERYDLDSDLVPFLGLIPNLNQIKFHQLSKQNQKKLIINLVGFEKNSERMLDSLLAIGGSITTWPQVGATATISGGIIVTTIKKIVIGEKVLSGRYYFCLDELLVADFDSPSKKLARTVKIKQLNELLNRDDT